MVFRQHHLRLKESGLKGPIVHLEPHLDFDLFNLALGAASSILDGVRSASGQKQTWLKGKRSYLGRLLWLTADGCSRARLRLKLSIDDRADVPIIRCSPSL